MKSMELFTVYKARHVHQSLQDQGPNEKKEIQKKFLGTVQKTEALRIINDTKREEGLLGR